MSVKIVEVGPRDGLQNEALSLDAALKVQLITRLRKAGLHHIEAGAFVSPKAVPQMATTAQVLEAFKADLTGLSVLTPNLKGFDLALKARVPEIAIFTAASESFTQHNINASIQQSLERFRPVCEQAKVHSIKVRGYVSCIVDCPYEGPIHPAKVAPVVEQLFQLGCHEISLGDTTGKGTAKSIENLIGQLKDKAPVEYLAGHFHDTFGQGLANVLSAFNQGLRIFDSSIAGLGGCPYAPGASGNLATEDLVYLFQGMGFCQDLDLAQLATTGQWISKQLNRVNASKASCALAARNVVITA